jgi:hypothetical protein
MYPHHVAAGHRIAVAMPIRDLIFYDFGDMAEWFESG